MIYVNALKHKTFRLDDYLAPANKASSAGYTLFCLTHFYQLWALTLKPSSLFNYRTFDLIRTNTRIGFQQKCIVHAGTVQIGAMDASIIDKQVTTI